MRSSSGRFRTRARGGRGDDFQPRHQRLVVVPLMVALVLCGAALFVGLVPGSCTADPHLAASNVGGWHTSHSDQPGCRAPLQPEQLYAQLLQLTVALSTDSGTGSGVLVDPEYVATNAHVFDIQRPGRPATVQFGDDSTGPGFLAWSDAQADLALVKLVQPRPKDHPVAELIPFDQVRGGQQVSAMGAPLGMQWSMTSGQVSAVRRDGPDGQPVIQFDAAASPGSSGGPLVDGCGRLLGLVSFGAADGQNLNFARPAEGLEVGLRLVGLR